MNYEPEFRRNDSPWRVTRSMRLVMSNRGREGYWFAGRWNSPRRLPWTVIVYKTRTTDRIITRRVNTRSAP